MLIQDALLNLYKKHRVIFWYDPQGELRDRFEALELPDVFNILLKNNEFSIKYQLMRLQPGDKFLVYSDCTKPADEDNWLLDLNLAFYEFSADRASLITQELGFAPERKLFIQEHLAFFNGEAQKIAFQNLSDPQDSDEQSRLKMMAVLAGSAPEFEQILFALFSNLDDHPLASWREIKLDKPFWNLVRKRFHYQSQEPSLKDLLIQLFLNRFYSTLASPEWRLSKEAAVFMNHWMDSQRYRNTFIQSSAQVAHQIQIKQILDGLSYRAVIACDVFQVIDPLIITGLANDLQQESIALQEAQAILRKRMTGFWHGHYLNLYLALQYAVELFDLFKTVDLNISSLQDGLNGYAEKYWKIDFAYRRFIQAFQNAEHTEYLKSLYEKVENIYVNRFLLKLNNNWQKQVDACDSWVIAGVRRQREFFTHIVKPYLDGEKRVAVIISDSLRFESGMELAEWIIREGTFRVDVEAMLSVLPSITESGMAALLPHKKMVFDEKSKSFCLDSVKANSTRRGKIISSAVPDAQVIGCDELLNLPSDQAREWAKTLRLIYIFHNGIDAVGDNFKTETEVFNATRREFEILVKLVKRVVNLNISHVLITSDHGYLYQHRALEESDFCAYQSMGEEIKTNRRFVIGRGLAADKNMKKFTAEQLGFDGNVEFSFPKSILRLRTQGGGNRYVHGGISLQEVVVPVLKISKQRKVVTRQVEIDIIKSQTRITTNEISISFDQKEPVSEYVLPRELKIGFYSPDGKLLSDEIKFFFNSVSLENRTREKKHKFIFKKEACNYNNQQVVLRLDERIPDTQLYRDYKQDFYIMHISIMNEFDDLL